MYGVSTRNDPIVIYIWNLYDYIILSVGDMPKIHISGRDRTKESVPVEEATSSSSVSSTTQHYVSTNPPDITTQNHSTTQTISPLNQQANDSNETVDIFLYVFLAIVLICVFSTFLYIIIRKRKNNRNNRPQEEANNRSQEEAVTVSLTDLDTPEDHNDTQANTSVSPLLNTDGTGACN